jgi:hypothetical protein
MQPVAALVRALRPLALKAKGLIAPKQGARLGRQDLPPHPLARWPFLYTAGNAPFVSHRDLARPAMLDIETVNICNNDCIICAYSRCTRQRQTMSMSLFERVISEYVSIGGGAVSLTPMVGEVFADKLLPARLEFLQSDRAISGVSATTNATLAYRYDDHELRGILRNFKRIHVSIYGLDSEEFKTMTRQDEYSNTLEQIRRILSLAPEGVVIVTFRLLKNRSPAEVAAWIDDVTERAGVARVPYSWGTEYGNWSQLDTSQPLPFDATWRAERVNTDQCLQPFVSFQVMVDGALSFCACVNYDNNQALALGSINEDSLVSLLQGDKLKKLWHWREYGVPDYCRHCSFHIPMEAGKSLPSCLRDPVSFIGG